jgi:thioredoxin 1
MKHLTSLDPSGLDRALAAGGRFLLELSAPRCEPCRALAPIVEAVATERALPAGELDVDAHPDVAAKLGIRGIPTLVLFEDGKELRRRVGSAPPSIIRAFLEP